MVHVIAVSETWLGPVVDDSIVALEGYSLLRNDRNTHGRGVALFIHRSLTVRHLCSFSTNWTRERSYPEYILCEVTPLNGNPVFVAVAYRPPHAPFVRDTDFFPKLCEHMHDYSTKVILGDFNADQLSLSEDAKTLRSFMEENSLTSVPFGATHHTADSHTWLDLCLVDALDDVTSYFKTDSPFIAGHDLISATLNIRVSRPIDHKFSYRNFKSVNEAGLNSYLARCDWSAVTNDGGLLEMGLNHFLRKFALCFRSLFSSQNLPIQQKPLSVAHCSPPCPDC